MSFHVDPQPEFKLAQPLDAKIDYLILFLKHFHRDRLPEPSLDPAMIPSDLPPGLAMIYRELGALVAIRGHDHPRPPFGTQDRLLPLAELRYVEGAIEFAQENQHSWVARCSLGQPDPPVYSNPIEISTAATSEFVVVCESLNHFLITLCLQEAVMSCANLAMDATDQHLIALPVFLQPLWLGGSTVFGESSHNFYWSPEPELLVMDFAGLWVGSPTSSLGDRILKDLDFRRIQGN
jgi:hypothetical protein